MFKYQQRQNPLGDFFSSILTFVDRVTKYLLLVGGDEVSRGISRSVRKLIQTPLLSKII